MNNQSETVMQLAAKSRNGFKGFVSENPMFFILLFIAVIIIFSIISVIGCNLWYKRGFNDGLKIHEEISIPAGEVYAPDDVIEE